MSSANQLQRPLTRRRILEAALALVDREGAEALTMRRLGRELGVAAMSLYNHVPGRAALLDGLSEVMVSRIGVEEVPADPRQTLHRFLGGIRTVALMHPDAFRLVGMRPLRGVDALRPVEAALGALRALGLTDRRAAHAYRVLVSYARGFALAEITGFTLEESGAPGDLPLDGFPHIAALVPHLGARDRDDAFEFGAEALLAGLEAQAGPGRR